jgi:hypothetical protein
MSWSGVVVLIGLPHVFENRKWELGVVQDFRFVLAPSRSVSPEYALVSARFSISYFPFPISARRQSIPG